MNIKEWGKKQGWKVIPVLCVLAFVGAAAWGIYDASQAPAPKPPVETGTATSVTKENANMDPRHGWVEVSSDNTGGVYTEDVKKRCDGTTLLYIFTKYKEGSIAAIPDSPECA